MKAKVRATGEIVEVEKRGVWPDTLYAFLNGTRFYLPCDLDFNLDPPQPEATRSEEQRELLKKLADEYAADNSFRVGDRYHDTAIEECVYKAYLAGAKAALSPSSSGRTNQSK